MFWAFLGYGCKDLNFFLIVRKHACFAGCAHTLNKATPPTGKIHQFSITVITCEPVRQFDVLQDLECPKPVQHSVFDTWKSYLYPFRHDSAVTLGEEKDDLVT